MLYRFTDETQDFRGELSQSNGQPRQRVLNTTGSSGSGSGNIGSSSGSMGLGSNNGISSSSNSGVRSSSGVGSSSNSGVGSSSGSIGSSFNNGIGSSSNGGVRSSSGIGSSSNSGVGSNDDIEGSQGFDGYQGGYNIRYIDLPSSNFGGNFDEFSYNDLGPGLVSIHVQLLFIIFFRLIWTKHHLMVVSELTQIQYKLKINHPDTVISAMDLTLKDTHVVVKSFALEIVDGQSAQPSWKELKPKRNN